MAPEFQFEKSQPAHTPLEVQIPEFREKAGRHIASMAFLDGFKPMGETESPYEDMRYELEDQIVEQQSAIDSIISAMDGKESRNDNDKHPVGVFAFLGPTGVGKSQMAKVLAKSLVSGISDAKPNLIKIDCSNYSNGHEISGLTGSPPGFVGREQPALLGKKNVEKPGTVILIDEIEKGEGNLFNLMLQMMEDGEIRLNDGSVTSFRDAIVIITSNLGAREMGALMSEHKVGFGVKESVKDKTSLEKGAIKAFEEFFKPEFVNRIDKLVVFHPLSEKGLADVLSIKLNEANEQYRNDYGAEISLSEKTIEHLVEIALKQPHFGARPLLRAFKDEIQSTFGKYTGNLEINDGTHVRVFHRDDFPENYAHAHEGNLIFTSKQEERLKRTINQSVTLFDPGFIDPTDPQDL